MKHKTIKYLNAMGGQSNGDEAAAWFGFGAKRIQFFDSIEKMGEATGMMNPGYVVQEAYMSRIALEVLFRPASKVSLNRQSVTRSVLKRRLSKKGTVVSHSLATKYGMNNPSYISSRAISAVLETRYGDASRDRAASLLLDNLLSLHQGDLLNLRSLEYLRGNYCVHFEDEFLSENFLRTNSPDPLQWYPSLFVCALLNFVSTGGYKAEKDRIEQLIKSVFNPPSNELDLRTNEDVQNSRKQAVASMRWKNSVTSTSFFMSLSSMDFTSTPPNSALDAHYFAIAVEADAYSTVMQLLKRSSGFSLSACSIWPPRIQVPDGSELAVATLMLWCIQKEIGYFPSVPAIGKMEKGLVTYILKKVTATVDDICTPPSTEEVVGAIINQLIALAEKGASSLVFNFRNASVAFYESSLLYAVIDLWLTFYAEGRNSVENSPAKLIFQGSQKMLPYLWDALKDSLDRNVHAPSQSRRATHLSKISRWLHLSCSHTLLPNLKKRVAGISPASVSEQSLGDVLLLREIAKRENDESTFTTYGTVLVKMGYARLSSESWS